MKKIILIQAHKDLDFINQLINELTYKDFIIYLHLDKKNSVDLNKINSKAIIIKNRIDVKWGEFSQVQAVISSLKQIKNEQENFSHVIFISGQDFPVKSSKKISTFLDQNIQNNFLEYFVIEENGKYSNFQWRYKKKHYPSNEVFYRKINSLFIRLGIIKDNNRKLLANYKYYWGSQWWILNNDAIEYILKSSTKSIFNYFKYTFCSDELYFQTLLLNSKLSSTIINNNLRYLEWEEYNHPKILTEKDYNLIIESDAFFCRKVDYKTSEKLLKLLSKNRNS
ncbi:beta-1,6-N-acetylglucosaminyltransferase [Chishuiella sp.]|uniref:beta-1,6-N-acetylglucosaminyltransferase n=1 Tax=Chishuiella sp. TaxID=1969467 RepID=UPI0028AE51C4|nr:beta-1,6-N-acetylglucosaminyltransferase [Chishuiella sp.]